MTEAIIMILGLDLGQAADFTALAIMKNMKSHSMPPANKDEAGMDMSEKEIRYYNCITLKRWQLGTSYTDIVDSVCRTCERPEVVGSDLVIDSTGVGRPIVDMLRKRKPPVSIKAVTITAGSNQSFANGMFNVAKSILVYGAVVALQQHRLLVVPGMPESATLIKELQNYRAKITAAANETFNAREGQHDDLVLAVALAIWWGERGGRKLVISC